MKFPFLTAADIECRVSTVSEKGISLLLYKDARCDMRILDDTVGAENWQREHYECKGNLFCRVGIKCGGEWVYKSDCGTESYTEKEKGEASDSFKRACFNWGIGRELYTAPFIWVPLQGKDGKPNYELNAKNQPKNRFVVTYMEVKDGRITALNIENGKSRSVFVYGDVLPKKAPEKKAPEYVCESCGAPIEAETGKDNRYYPPAQVAEMTKAKFGKALCTRCRNA